MKLSTTFIIAAFFGMAFNSFNSFAQQPNLNTSSSAISISDPIVETLDSLVMLNNVIRYNNVNGQVIGETDSKNIPYYSDEIYAQRLSKISSPIPLSYNDEVKKYIDLYAYKKRGLTSRVLGLSNLYFPLYEEILDQEDLPLEFKYLSVVESALNPVAVSRVGATGLWQFMFNTGKMYDLKINSYIDERRDPVKATHAACRYFKDMYAIYGDWLLVIAAYNCGAGNVNKAIRRSGGKTNFWEISKYLPAETRGYVPAFIAVTYVMNYASEHNIFAVQPAFNYFEVDTIAVDNNLSLKKIAAAVGLPADVLAYLNPIYKRGIIPDTDYPNVLRLPASYIPAYLAAESSLSDPVSTPTAYVTNLTAGSIIENESVSTSSNYKVETKKIKKIYSVKSGDNLSAVARKLDCTTAELKKWNKLNSTVIRKGQQLSYYSTIKIKVPVEVSPIENENIASTDSISTTDTVVAENLKEKKTDSKLQQEFIYHKVEKGDTLWNIAKRYAGATVEQIMEMNRITNTNSLIPGTRIKVKVNG